MPKQPAKRKSRSHPWLFVIAGPNGAGKTTFASKFLPRYARCQEFVNADLIAAGLAPFAPESAAVRAGRVKRSLANFFQLYQPLATEWSIFDNSTDSPHLIASRTASRIRVADAQLYDQISQISRISRT